MNIDELQKELETNLDVYLQTRIGNNPLGFDALYKLLTRKQASSGQEVLEYLKTAAEDPAKNEAIVMLINRVPHLIENSPEPVTESLVFPKLQPRKK